MSTNQSSRDPWRRRFFALSALSGAVVLALVLLLVVFNPDSSESEPGAVVATESDTRGTDAADNRVPEAPQSEQHQSQGEQVADRQSAAEQSVSARSDREDSDRGASTVQIERESDDPDERLEQQQDEYQEYDESSEDQREDADRRAITASAERRSDDADDRYEHGEQQQDEYQEYEESSDDDRDDSEYESESQQHDRDDDYESSDDQEYEQEGHHDSSSDDDDRYAAYAEFEGRVSTVDAATGEFRLSVYEAEYLGGAQIPAEITVALSSSRPLPSWLREGRWVEAEGRYDTTQHTLYAAEIELASDEADDADDEYGRGDEQEREYREYEDDEDEYEDYDDSSDDDDRYAAYAEFEGRVSAVDAVTQVFRLRVYEVEHTGRAQVPAEITVALSGARPLPSWLREGRLVEVEGRYDSVEGTLYAMEIELEDD